jgi:ABC-type glycerol-3-phosphate transport system substrate-binding protein
MKVFFPTCLAVLAALSALLYWTLPERQGRLPVLYWVTQNDPVKRETIALFRDWLVAQGLPPVEVLIDNASQQKTGTTGEPKALIQGVSGMGGDLLDVYLNQMELFQATGMLMDVTNIAPRQGFGPDVTYPAIRTDLVLEGRQYGFPRNVDVTMCWVNRDTFARYGLPEPPARWTMDEFEERGRRFVAAANPPGSRKRVFFLNRVWPPTLRRGLGLSTYNETGTRCTLDDPRNVEVLKRIYRWTVEERLIPTVQEQEALAADASGWDSSFSLFATGRFAMIYEGLWALIRLRPKGDFQLSAVEPFSGDFPNTEIGCGVVSVYAGSKHPELALQFLRFLASEPFNLLVARSGDSLPVLPRYAKADDYHPHDHPGEWAAKDAFAKAGREIGIAASKSPFVLPSIVFRSDNEAIEAMLAGRMTPEEAAHAAASRVNTEIALRVQQDPTLRQRFKERMKIQQQIEARRAAGRPVPAAWISDPFHLAYYRAHGWLETEAAP